MLHAGAIRFVDDKYVRDLQDPRFNGLNVVAQARRFDYYSGVRESCNVHFTLPRADSFDDDDVITRRVEDLRERRGGLRDSTHRTARSHRADEHSVIAGEIAHAHAVAQHRSARERTRRVHRNDGNSFIFCFAIVQGELIDER